MKIAFFTEAGFTGKTPRSNPNMRTDVGWVCALAFAYHYLLQPLLVFILTASGVDLPELPSFDMSTLLTVLGGLLGIGGLRSYEKTKGLTK